MWQNLKESQFWKDFSGQSGLQWQIIASAYAAISFVLACFFAFMIFS